MKNIFKNIVRFILMKEASFFIKKNNPKIVALTGSVAKSSAKNMVYSLAKSKYETVRTPGNLNTDFGIALTILGREYGKDRGSISWLKDIIFGFKKLFSKSAQVYVLEMGTDIPGDIEYIVKNINPNISILTLFPDKPVHMEAFSSKEELYSEKANLIKYLSENGTVIYNASDKNISKYLSLAPSGTKQISFGFVGSDVIADGYEINYSANKPVGISFYLKTDTEDTSITLDGVLGKQWLLPSLATAAYGISEGFSLGEVEKAIKQSEFEKGRMRILDGVSGSILIDDTYNASPIAMMEALNSIYETKVSGRRIGILADMMELGRESESAHREVVSKALSGLDMLIIKGEKMHTAFRSLDIESSIEVILMSDNKGIVSYIKNKLKEGDLVLCKGSRSMKMDEVVVELLAKESDRKLTLQN